MIGPDWRSSKDINSKYLTVKLNLDTVVNVTDLVNLTHAAGFRSLSVLEANPHVINDVKADRMKSRVERVPQADINESKVLEKNVPWPELAIFISPLAFNLYRDSQKNPEQVTDSHQLDQLLKKALLGNGVREHTNHVGTAAEMLPFLIQFGWISREIADIYSTHITSYLAVAILSVLSHASFSNIIRGNLYGTEYKYAGAKTSVFFGTKFDLIAALYFRTVTSKLAAAAHNKNVRK